MFERVRTLMIRVIHVLAMMHMLQNKLIMLPLLQINGELYFL